LVIAQLVQSFLGLAVFAFLVFGLAYALRPAEGVGRHLGETVSAFVAFFLLLLGLRMTIGSVHDPEIFLGDFFASLALTFFWAMRRRHP
jgi:hypothetical protein